MRIWVEDLGCTWYGHTFAISSEKHDGIIYKADSVKDAVKAYEADRHCKVDAVTEV